MTAEQAPPIGSGDPASAPGAREPVRELPALPGGLPLLGHLGPFLRDPAAFLLRHHLAHGEAFTFGLAGRQVVSFCGPRVNAAVLNSPHEDLDRREMARRVRYLFGPDVLIDVPEDVMAAQNRRLLPAIQREAMAGHVATMLDIAERYTAGWRAHGTVDLVTAVREMVGLISAHCLVGPRFGTTMGRRIPTLLGALGDALVLSLAVDPRLPLPAYRRRDQARQALRRAIVQLAPADRPAGLPHSPFDLLTGAAPSEHPALDAATAADLVISWLFAGLETTAVYASWTGALLLRNRDRLPALLAEQRELFAGDPPPSPRLLHRMERLGHCMTEVERLNPSVPLLLRTAARDLVIEGYPVPRGHLVMLSPAASHRLPQVFRDPERFDPDRYLPGRAEHCATPSPLIAFSGGHSPCQGMAFAQATTKAIWSVLLRTFELELVDPDWHDSGRTYRRAPRQRLVRYRRRTV